MRKVKKYYVGCATNTTGIREIDFVAGPYDTFEDAYVFKQKIAKDYGLNFCDYEWSSHINIYRSTVIEYAKEYLFKKVGSGKHKEYKHCKRSNGKPAFIEHKIDLHILSEDDFLEKLTEML